MAGSRLSTLMSFARQKSASPRGSSVARIEEVTTAPGAARQISIDKIYDAALDSALWQAAYAGTGHETLSEIVA